MLLSLNVCITSILTFAVADGVSFSAGFSDDMVLQMAPAHAAVYGISVSDDPVSVSIVGKDGFGRDVSYRSQAIMSPWNGTWAWKALLRPQGAGGDFVVAVSSGEHRASISRVTFGEVWFCSGQSNMALETFYTFSALEAKAEIAQGKYDTLRHFMYGDMALKYIASIPQWVTATGSASESSEYVWHNATWSASQPTTKDQHSAFDRFGATCLYFGMELMTKREHMGKPIIPIGLIQSAIGGSQIESWMSNESLDACSRESLSGGAAPATQLWYGMVTPFVNMTISGWIWYQGENNVGGIMGSSAEGTGYGCELPELVRLWRHTWSSVPQTTNALAPFGIATLAAGGSEGNGHNMAMMRWSQTGNYGYWPSPALPNTFGAQAYDLGDPWANVADGSPDNDKHHCALPDPATARYGPECTYWNETAWNIALREYASKVRLNAPSGIPGNNFMNGIHPRLKRPLASRLAEAVLSLTSGGGPLNGPTLSGCSVHKELKRMELLFNKSLLGGDTVLAQSFDSNVSNWAHPDSLSLMVCTASPPLAKGASCTDKCTFSGYCNEGNVSCCQAPSCEMGCTIAAESQSLDRCKSTCLSIPKTCEYKFGSHQFQMCEGCPATSHKCSRSCGGASIVACLRGCEYAHGMPPEPYPPANATTCACASWGTVKCDPPDSWPCDPYINPGNTFSYCEVGPGWKPPLALRHSASKESHVRNYSARPRWSSPGLRADPSMAAISIWQPAPVKVEAGKVVADLSAFGEDNVLAIRYAWPLGDSGDTCCPGKDVADGLAPCIPGSCPLMSAKSQLPANPFFATVIQGACHCMFPQDCSDNKSGDTILVV